MKYSTLLLDADDTLLDFKSAERQALRAALEAGGYPANDEVCGRYHEINDSLWKAFERGEIEKSEINAQRFSRLFSEFGFCGDPAKFGETYISNLSKQGQLLEGARDFLENVVKVYDLYAITNGIDRVQKGRFIRADLNGYFGGVFISEAVGAGKPDKKYFDFVLGRVKEKDRSRIVVIGDSLTSDIKGAQNAGLDSIWFARKPGRASLPGVIPTYTAGTFDEIITVLENA